MQIPNERTGKDIIDGVVVDEEAVGSGAKILHGEAALAHYLSQHFIGNLKGFILFLIFD